jgi:hypothetical protein
MMLVTLKFGVSKIMFKTFKERFDNECELKYRHLKGLARNLCNNPWDKNLRQKVAVYKKDFNRLTRKKHRIFKNNLLQKISNIVISNV